jgi:hypothetical protein
MHHAFQRRYAALIWTNESLVGPHVFKVLDSNVLVETIDAREEFIALFGSGLLVTSAKRAVEGTPQ